MKLIAALCVVLALTASLAEAKKKHKQAKAWKGFTGAADEQLVTDDFVAHINAAQKGWVASTDQGWMANITRAGALSLCGTRLDGNSPTKLPRLTYSGSSFQAPAAFDSRTNWPSCPTISKIRDQSACGACWAFAAVEAMSDRICTYGGAKNLSISAQDMNSCCYSCGDGCGGGYPSEAWDYWVHTGVVSEACSPFSLPSCNHHMPNAPNPCPTNEYPTPACTKKCQDGETWASAKHYGSSSYSVSGESDIMTEVAKNGPVEVAFTVYEDFLAYKSGVYKHTSGGELGGHAVRLLGWGTDPTGGPYWIIANSWNPNWGNNGYFWIARGVDECGIEDEGDCGVPKS